MVLNKSHSPVVTNIILTATVMSGDFLASPKINGNDRNRPINPAQEKKAICHARRTIGCATDSIDPSWISNRSAILNTFSLVGWVFCKVKVTSPDFGHAEWVFWKIRAG